MSYWWMLCRWWGCVADFPRRVWWFIQRGRRGWSEADAWSIFSHIDRIVVGAVGDMADNPFGYPGNITSEEWGLILRQIVDGFQAHIDLDDEMPVHNSDREKELQERFDRGMALFAQWYGHLWT